jgi:hypothetical protein
MVMICSINTIRFRAHGPPLRNQPPTHSTSFYFVDMSTRRRGLAAIFGGRESHPQPVPSPPASPRPGRVPDVPMAEERIMTSEELQQGVESLETVLRTMDQVRDQTNRYNAALREHARSLRGYAVSINMITAREDKGQRANVGEDKVSENLLVHCANYYDRLAEAQETLVYLTIRFSNIGTTIPRRVQHSE